MAKELFGTLPDGGEVWLCKLKNARGMKAEIISLGGIIRTLEAPDAAGKMADVVLGLDSLEDYVRRPSCAGAVTGRVANRVDGAKFTLNGKEFHLDKNHPGFCLHGGKAAYASRNFEVERCDDSSVRLYLHDTQPGGFPGALKLWVEYALTGENELKITYTVRPDEDTPVNITNHVYFNLAGHEQGDPRDQFVKIYAQRYTFPDSRSIPTGKLASVEGTPYDLREPRPMREGLTELAAQNCPFGGYDINFVIDGEGYRMAAEAFDKASGRRMQVFTDLPGMQLYTGNNIPDMPGVKGGAHYVKYSGYCFETQFFPDSIHHDNFPSCVVKAGTEFVTVTAYKFIS